MVAREDMYEVEEIFNWLEGFEFDDTQIEGKIARMREVIQPMIENERVKELKEKLKAKWSWGGVQPIKVISRASQVLSSSTWYREATEEIKSCDKETQDILHALEFEILDEEQEKELMNHLKKVRQYRRSAKNFVELIEPLHLYVQKNQTVLKGLGEVQRETVELVQKLERRTYTPRELTSLEEAFRQSSASKEIAYKPAVHNI